KEGVAFKLPPPPANPPVPANAATSCAFSIICGEVWTSPVSLSIDHCGTAPLATWPAAVAPALNTFSGHSCKRLSSSLKNEFKILSTLLLNGPLLLSLGSGLNLTGNSGSSPVIYTLFNSGGISAGNGIGAVPNGSL